MKAQIVKLKEFLEAPGGADWERKNKLKVYEAVYLMASRDFKVCRCRFTTLPCLWTSNL